MASPSLRGMDVSGLSEDELFELLMKQLHQQDKQQAASAATGIQPMMHQELEPTAEEDEEEYEDSEDELDTVSMISSVVDSSFLHPSVSVSVTDSFKLDAALVSDQWSPFGTRITQSAVRKPTKPRTAPIDAKAAYAAAYIASELNVAALAKRVDTSLRDSERNIRLVTSPIIVDKIRRANDPSTIHPPKLPKQLPQSMIRAVERNIFPRPMNQLMDRRGLGFIDTVEKISSLSAHTRQQQLLDQMMLDARKKARIRKKRRENAQSAAKDDAELTTEHANRRAALINRLEYSVRDHPYFAQNTHHPSSHPSESRSTTASPITPTASATPLVDSLLASSFFNTHFNHQFEDSTLTPAQHEQLKKCRKMEHYKRNTRRLLESQGKKHRSTSSGSDDGSESNPNIQMKRTYRFNDEESDKSETEDQANTFLTGIVADDPPPDEFQQSLIVHSRDYDVSSASLPTIGSSNLGTTDNLRKVASSVSKISQPMPPHTARSSTTPAQQSLPSPRSARYSNRSINPPPSPLPKPPKRDMQKEMHKLRAYVTRKARVEQGHQFLFDEQKEIEEELSEKPGERPADYVAKFAEASPTLGNFEKMVVKTTPKPPSTKFANTHLSSTSSPFYVDLSNWMTTHGKLKKTSVDVEQIARCAKMFELLDANNDGTIEVKEMQTALRELGMHVDLKHLKLRMCEFDPDGDGKINFEEFLHGFSSIATWSSHLKEIAFENQQLKQREEMLRKESDLWKEVERRQRAQAKIKKQKAAEAEQKLEEEKLVAAAEEARRRQAELEAKENNSVAIASEPKSPRNHSRAVSFAVQSSEIQLPVPSMVLSISTSNQPAGGAMTRPQTSPQYFFPPTSPPSSVQVQVRATTPLAEIPPALPTPLPASGLASALSLEDRQNIACLRARREQLNKDASDRYVSLRSAAVIDSRESTKTESKSYDRILKRKRAKAPKHALPDDIRAKLQLDVPSSPSNNDSTLLIHTHPLSKPVHSSEGSHDVPFFLWTAAFQRHSKLSSLIAEHNADQTADMRAQAVEIEQAKAELEATFANDIKGKSNSLATRRAAERPANLHTSRMPSSMSATTAATAPTPAHSMSISVDDHKSHKNRSVGLSTAASVDFPLPTQAAHHRHLSFAQMISPPQLSSGNVAIAAAAAAKRHQNRPSTSSSISNSNSSQETAGVVPGPVARATPHRTVSTFSSSTESSSSKVRAPSKTSWIDLLNTHDSKQKAAAHATESNNQSFKSKQTVDKDDSTTMAMLMLPKVSLTTSATDEEIDKWAEEAERTERFQANVKLMNKINASAAAIAGNSSSGKTNASTVPSASTAGISVAASYSTASSPLPATLTSPIGVARQTKRMSTIHGVAITDLSMMPSFHVPKSDAINAAMRSHANSGMLNTRRSARFDTTQENTTVGSQQTLREEVTATVIATTATNPIMNESALNASQAHQPIDPSSSASATSSPRSYPLNDSRRASNRNSARMSVQLRTQNRSSLGESAVHHRNMSHLFRRVMDGNATVAVKPEEKSESATVENNPLLSENQPTSGMEASTIIEEDPTVQRSPEESGTATPLHEHSNIEFYRAASMLEEQQAAAVLGATTTLNVDLSSSPDLATVSLKRSISNGNGVLPASSSSHDSSSSQLLIVDGVNNNTNVTVSTGLRQPRSGNVVPLRQLLYGIIPNKQSSSSDSASITPSVGNTRAPTPPMILPIVITSQIMMEEQQQGENCSIEQPQLEQGSQQQQQQQQQQAQLLQANVPNVSHSRASSSVLSVIRSTSMGIDISVEAPSGPDSSAASLFPSSVAFPVDVSVDAASPVSQSVTVSVTSPRTFPADVRELPPAFSLPEEHTD